MITFALLTLVVLVSVVFMAPPGGGGATQARGGRDVGRGAARPGRQRFGYQLLCRALARARYASRICPQFAGHRGSSITRKATLASDCLPSARAGRSLKPVTDRAPRSTSLNSPAPPGRTLKLRAPGGQDQQIVCPPGRQRQGRERPRRQAQPGAAGASNAQADAPLTAAARLGVPSHPRRPDGV